MISEKVKEFLQMELRNHLKKQAHPDTIVLVNNEPLDVEGVIAISIPGPSYEHGGEANVQRIVQAALRKYRIMDAVFFLRIVGRNYRCYGADDYWCWNDNHLFTGSSHVVEGHYDECIRELLGNMFHKVKTYEAGAFIRNNKK